MEGPFVGESLRMSNRLEGFANLTQSRAFPPQSIFIRIPGIKLTRKNRLRYSHRKERDEMARKVTLNKISIYIPDSKIGQQPVERLIKQGEEKDRSINYLVVEAIMEYLNREEKE